MARRLLRDPGLRPGALLWLCAPIWYLLCELGAALAFPGYNYAVFYISDLGIAEHAVLDDRTLASQIPQVMNAGFIGTGLLFLLGAIMLASRMRKGLRSTLFVTFSVVYAFGWAFVGLVSSAPSHEENGLMTYHLLGAAAAIGGGNLLALLSAGPFRFVGRVRWAGVILGAMGFVFTYFLGRSLFFPDGVWERASVYTFMLWQLIIAIVLLRRSLPRKRRMKALPVSKTDLQPAEA